MKCATTKIKQNECDDCKPIMVLKCIVDGDSGWKKKKNKGKTTNHEKWLENIQSW